MGSLGSELTLSSGFSSVIGDRFFSRIDSEQRKTYVQGLEEEMKKIVAFRRDLPITIEIMEQVVMMFKTKVGMCERSGAPILEEFIPMKSSSCRDDEMVEMNEKSENQKEEDKIVTNTDKRDWMSSVQLWNSDNNQNQCPNTPIRSNSNGNCNRVGLKYEIIDKKKLEEDIKWAMLGSLSPHLGEKAAGRSAFMPFKGLSGMVAKEDEIELPKVPGLTLVTPEIKKILREEVLNNGFNSKSSCSTGSGSSSGNNVQSHSGRKQRRCWSPELHRRFVNALQQLGGAQVATPKQIRELMQVDGLTNDEVKSHLQKYRLHSRKSGGKRTYSGPLDLWPSTEPSCETSKPITSQSGSPTGPLDSRDTSMVTLGMADEYDEKSESCWKNHIHLCG